LFYNQTSPELVAGSAMPFNDEFNDVLKKVVVMMAKNRNQYDFSGDYAFYSMFQTAAGSRIVSRRHNKLKSLGY